MLPDPSAAEPPGDPARLRAVSRPDEHLRRPRQPADARAPLRVARDRLRAARQRPRRALDATPTTSTTSAAARTATSACAPRTCSRPSATRCTPPPRAARSCSACAAATSCSATPTQLGEETIPGVGLLDVRTVREPTAPPDRQRRDRGRARGGDRVLAGFENHGGRTHLGAGQQPLGRVLQGPRQRRAQRLEGARAATRDRHLPARPAAAEERLVRRLADRARASRAR
jgi:hypothetical protein